MIRLVVFKQTPARIRRKPIEKLFKMIMKEVSDKNAQGKINLIFTSDRKIQKLNKCYRRTDQPTDVLSFNLEQPPGRSSIFGEIYISVETSKRQAGEYDTTLNDELLRLFCHGLLHVLGYDHIKAGDRRKMEECEKYFLKAFIVS